VAKVCHECANPSAINGLQREEPRRATVGDNCKTLTEGGGRGGHDAAERRSQRDPLSSTVSLQDQLETYHEQGFVILPALLSGAEVEAIRSALRPYLEVGANGRNNFEGERTRRVYSLVGRGPLFEATVEHPAVLGLLDQLLEVNYLLTASQAICISPGETPQPIHYDDAFFRVPRPRPAISVSTIWAVDDFIADSGATEVIPGSHRWGDDQLTDTDGVDTNASPNPAFVEQLRPVEMEAGSCVLFAGTLLHRGGGSRPTASPRRAFSHQYCEPWARQQENFCLSIPNDRAARMSKRVRELLGYSIHPPFMGQIAGRHPQKALEPEYRNSLEVDDEAADRLE
jgi:ectoine hydroxylase-related dioxygenase (phytanoyl-CoA dioxygenase family)